MTCMSAIHGWSSSTDVHRAGWRGARGRGGEGEEHSRRTGGQKGGWTAAKRSPRKERQAEAGMPQSSTRSSPTASEIRCTQTSLTSGVGLQAHDVLSVCTLARRAVALRLVALQTTPRAHTLLRPGRTVVCPTDDVGGTSHTTIALLCVSMCRAACGGRWDGGRGPAGNTRAHAGKHTASSGRRARVRRDSHAAGA